MLAASVGARAQFTIVDADSREPLPGVYVFGEDGTLLTISNENGKVKSLDGTLTLSMLSYEPMTVDAKTAKGEILLKAKPYELAEVVVDKADYMKMSATFRDVVKNFNRVVVYREGMVDYYYNLKTKKFKRIVRACRQYEHQDLRNAANDSIKMEFLPLLDFNRVHHLQSTDSSRVQGDTIFVGAMHGKTVVKDGIMHIAQNGLYRSVIDNIKFNDRTSISVFGVKYKVTKSVIDWVHSSPSGSYSTLVAVRQYREEEFQWSKKSVVVPIQTQSDLVVNSITTLNKDEAKEEMKDKGTVTDFTVPDCLPPLPESIHAQIGGLVLRKFREW